MMLSKDVYESQVFNRLRCAIVERYGNDLEQDELLSYCELAMSKGMYVAGVLVYVQALPPDLSCYGGRFEQFEIAAMHIAIQLVRLGIELDNHIPLY